MRHCQCFRGKGKQKQLRSFSNHSQNIETPTKLSEKRDIDKDFVNFKRSSVSCTAVHSFGTLTTFGSLSSRTMSDCEKKVNANINIDFSSFYPCINSLKQAVKRANFQTAISERLHVPIPDIVKASEEHEL